MLRRFVPLFERGRNLSRAARDASVVEQNDFSLSREAIGHRWIPMVHSAGVVLVEDEWYAGCLTEAAIGKADAVSLDELRRRCLGGLRRPDRHLVESLSMKREWKYFSRRSCRHRQ